MILFRNNLERNLHSHFLVELDGSSVFADFLDVVFEDDELAVYVMTEFLKSLGDLDSIYRTEDGTGSACLGADCQSYALESCGSSLSVGFDLGNLMSALTLVL